MMEDKLAGLLGMCRRAGRLTTGFDAVTALAAEGRAALILAASDVSGGAGARLDRSVDQGDDRPHARPAKTGRHPGDGG